MACLLDSNILLRWIQKLAVEHAQAVAAVNTLIDQGDHLFVTPQNLVEFWSVATRPISSNGLGLTPSQTDKELRAIEQLFPLLPDTPAIHSEWRRLIVSVGVSGRQVHDARLVAAMRAHGLTRILTFNASDFARYPEITALHPSDV